MNDEKYGALLKLQLNPRILGSLTSAAQLVTEINVPRSLGPRGKHVFNYFWNENYTFESSIYNAAPENFVT